MENLPVIMSGTRVVLTPACREDVPAYLHWITDPELNIFLLDYGKVCTLEQEYAWYDDVVAKSGNRLVQMDIRLSEDQKLIGNCGLFDINHREGTAEVGILIGEKEYLSKGYGSEALYLLCRYGFDKLNLHSILLRHLSINARGDKAYRKIGFREFGCFRESVVRDRVRYDMVYMDLLESELRNPAAGEDDAPRRPAPGVLSSERTGAGARPRPPASFDGRTGIRRRHRQTAGIRGDGTPCATIHHTTTCQGYLMPRPWNLKGGFLRLSTGEWLVPDLRTAPIGGIFLSGASRGVERLRIVDVGSGTEDH